MSQYSLEKTLMDLSNELGESKWTIRDAVEGVQIFGSNGSGKTSGSGKMLARKYLENGFGGLVLTVKPDEAAQWIDYCKRYNRIQDLILVEPRIKEVFNFLEYETSKKLDGLNLTENIVQVLKTVVQASEQKSGSGGGDGDFWVDSLDSLMSHTVDLCLLAYDKVTVKDLYEIVQSLPKRDSVKDEKKEKPLTPYEKAFTTAQAKYDKIHQEWKEGLTPEQLLSFTDPHEYMNALCEDYPICRTLHMVDNFFNEFYIDLNPKTRSIIDFSFSNFLFRLLKDPVYSMFCKGTSTWTPEDCLDGKIILINLPVKIYHKVGRDAQILVKYIWQRAMEKRDIRKNDRPVFCWADEAQHFIHEHDADTQATARSSRICTVYLTQNLPNYNSAMGGNRYKEKVSSFLGTLGTKIFHSNGEPETNAFASTLIGDIEVPKHSQTINPLEPLSESQTEHFDFQKIVRPEDFIRLKTGGVRNKGIVEAFIYRHGDPFLLGLNVQKVSFSQTNN